MIEAPRRDPGRRWLAGLTVGASAGFATLVIPTLGWFLVLAFLIPALLVGRARLFAAGGLLIGLGAVWLVLVGRVALQCPARDPSEIGCHAPDLGPWLAAGGLMLGAGMLVTAFAIRRASRM